MLTAIIIFIVGSLAGFMFGAILATAKISDMQAKINHLEDKE